MRIVSWNVNGLRAAERYDFVFKAQNFKADFICLQEIKAKLEQLSDQIKNLDGYHLFVNSARRPGYSGVATYAKRKPLKIIKEIGEERFDGEGRILGLVYDNFTLLNLYMPHGGREKNNLDYKIVCYQKLISFIKKLSRPLILVGDFNIAHKKRDLARPNENQDNIMFTYAERKQIDNLINSGFVDSFRKFNQNGGFYTWWSYRQNARAKNLGWRIDYIFVSKDVDHKIKGAEIWSNIYGSDHCPVVCDLDV